MSGSSGAARVLAGPVPEAGIGPPPPLNDGEFALFRDLIHQEAGIHLSDNKRALLVGRLAHRLRALGLTSFGAYYRRIVAAGDSAERDAMLDAMCTHETHFFREPRHFAYLTHTVLPQWRAAAAAGRRSRQVRVWSAGCSTGEEPYSLAMLLASHLPAAAGWACEILATDLSLRALEQAQAGVWPLEKAGEIPLAYLRAFMLRGTRSQAGRLKAGPLLRALLRFQRVNLNDERYQVAGLFDLIVCRNVMIYFDAVTRDRVVQRLLGHLQPGGYLFVGHAESLRGSTDRLRSVLPTIYRLRETR